MTSRTDMRLIVLALLAGLVTTGAAQESPPETARDRAIEGKGRGLEVVTRELKARENQRLNADTRTRRDDVLSELGRYAARRQFTENTRWPGRDMPYFIDDHGTRCALAHLIEFTGNTDLVKSLALTQNNAYISQLVDDGRVSDWLSTYGLTPAEIAYIQGPGFNWTEPPPPEALGRSRLITRQPGGRARPSEPFGTSPSANRRTTTPIVARNTTPTQSVARTGRAFGGRPKKTSSSANWQEWWDLNRDVFVNVRERYHAPVGTTPNSAGDGAKAPSRGMEIKDITQAVIPLTARMIEEDDDFMATGLMVLARIARDEEKNLVVDKILARLRNPRAKDRDYVILALGVVKSERAAPTLQAIVLDKRAGRKAVKRSTSIPDRVRAIAALALGYSGVDGSVGILRGLLDNERNVSPDLRAAAVFALGLAAREGGDAGEAVPYLIEHIDHGAWPLAVRAHVPLALAQTDDRGAVPALREMVAKFRGPAAVRRSAVLALGRLSRGLEGELAKTLMIVAQRDPDPAVRQFAISAIGDAASRDGSRITTSAAQKATLDKIAKFLHDGVSGHFHQPTDRAWYALSAGMFASRVGPRRESLRDALVSLATKGSKPSDRAAATLALGLVADEPSRVALAKIQKKAKNHTVRGYAYEARGLAQDSTVKDELMAMVKDAKSPWFSYRAALGLAYLRGQNTVPAMMTAMKETSSESVRAIMTRAVGQLGDHRSVPELLALAEDRENNKITRERALAALGMVAEESDLSWTASIKRGYNFTHPTPAIGLVLQLF